MIKKILLLLLLGCLLLTSSFGSDRIVVYTYTDYDYGWNLYDQIKYNNYKGYTIMNYNFTEVEVKEKKIELEKGFIYGDSKAEKVEGKCVITKEYQEEINQMPKFKKPFIRLFDFGNATTYQTKGIKIVDNEFVKEIIIKGCTRTEPTHAQRGVSILNPFSFCIPDWDCDNKQVN